MPRLEHNLRYLRAEALDPGQYKNILERQRSELMNRETSLNLVKMVELLKCEREN